MNFSFYLHKDFVVQLLEHWIYMQEVPGSNPAKVITYLIFGEIDTAKSSDFLKCPAQELSNGIVFFVNGTQKFASLDFREVCLV